MNQSLKDLQRIPGVGKSISQDLLDLGVTGVAPLADRDPQELYEQLRALRQQHIDRCVLYVFRCAVYFADNEAHGRPHDPELLRWWNWKDSALPITPKAEEE